MPASNPLPPLITLTTDFGLRDSYVGQMKGRLLSLLPGAAIVDISHELEPFDILSAAWTLFEAAGWFPDGAIHIAVVDPGVGGARRRIIVQIRAAERFSFLVGPDNGIFSVFLSAKQGVRAWSVDDVTRFSHNRPGEFSVFDGRDVFAPIAAGLGMGIKPEELGNEIGIDHLVRLDGAERVVVSGRAADGRVIKIDRFGNCATNLFVNPAELASWEIQLTGMNAPLRAVKNFEQLSSGEAGMLINSQGGVEMVLKQRNFCKTFQISCGTAVRMTKNG